MKDLISRQAAIDAFYQYPNVNWATLDVMGKINELPPIQPDIIRCKDCKHYGKHKEDYMCGLNVLAYVHENEYCSRAEGREESRNDSEAD